MNAGDYYWQGEQDPGELVRLNLAAPGPSPEAKGRPLWMESPALGPESKDLKSPNPPPPAPPTFQAVQLWVHALIGCFSGAPAF